MPDVICPSNGAFTSVAARKLADPMASAVAAFDCAVVIVVIKENAIKTATDKKVTMKKRFRLMRSLCSPNSYASRWGLYHA